MQSGKNMRLKEKIYDKNQRNNSMKIYINTGDDTASSP